MKFILSLFLLYIFISPTNAMLPDSLDVLKKNDSLLSLKRLELNLKKANIKDDELRPAYKNADRERLNALKKGDSVTSRKYSVQLDSISELDRQKNGRRFYLLGDAGIIKSIRDSGKVSGNGSFGLKYVSESEQLNVKVLMLVASSNNKLKVTYSSNSEVTNSLDFGSSILTPTLGNNVGKSGLVEFVYYPTFKDKKYFYQRLGLSGNIEVASQTWSDTVKDVHVSILAFEGGIFYDLIPLSSTTNRNLALRFNILSFIGRVLWGDIFEEQDFENKLIGETKTFFCGFKTGFELELNGVVASVQFPFIVNSKLKGLGKGQLLGGFNVSAGVPLNF